MANTQESFWQFSTHLYACDAVAEICLFLQESAAADVNLLLFACWYGRKHGVLPNELLARSFAFSQLWSHKLVQPLRAGRTWMKHADAHLFTAAQQTLLPQYQALRAQIKATELEAEHFQQNLLESLTVGTPARVTLSIEEQRQDIRQNLLRCLQEPIAAPAPDQDFTDAISLLVQNTVLFQSGP